MERRRKRANWEHTGALHHSWPHYPPHPTPPISLLSSSLTYPVCFYAAWSDLHCVAVCQLPMFPERDLLRWRPTSHNKTHAILSHCTFKSAFLSGISSSLLVAFVSWMVIVIVKNIEVKQRRCDCCAVFLLDHMPWRRAINDSKYAAFFWPVGAIASYLPLFTMLSPSGLSRKHRSYVDVFG